MSEIFLRRSSRLAAVRAAAAAAAQPSDKAQTIHRILSDIDGSAGNVDIFLDAAKFGNDNAFLTALICEFRERHPLSRNHIVFGEDETRVSFLWWRPEDDLLSHDVREGTAPLARRAGGDGDDDDADADDGDCCCGYEH